MDRTPEQDKAISAYKAARECLKMTKEIEAAIGRKRSLRDAEKAAWIGSIRLRHQGLEAALEILEPLTGLDPKFL